MTLKSYTMKNLLLLFTLLAGGVVASQAQTNTFPTSGKVGIGTTSPLEKLHIFRDSTNYYNALLVLEDDIGAGYTQMAFRATSRTYNLGVGNGSETGFSVANKFYLYDVTSNAMRWVTDASGNTGFGITTPGNRVSIYASAANNSGLQFSRLNNTATAGNPNGKVLTLDASGNVILVRDSIGLASGWAQTGNTGTSPSTDFLGTIDNQDLTIRTNNVERGRYLSNGNFKYGTGSDNGKKFQVYGTGFFSSAVGIGTDSTGDGNYSLFVAKGIRTRKVRVDVEAWPDYVFADNYKLPKLSEIEQFISKNNHLPGMPSADEVAKEGVDVGENQAMLLKKIEELTLYLIESNKQIEALKAKVNQQEQQIRSMNQ